MAELIIYAKDHTSQSPHIRCKAVKWEESEQYMGTHSITFDVQSYSPIEWGVGDWCAFRGETFYLNYMPQCSQNARIGDSGKAFVYESVKMETAASELTRCELLDIIPTSGEHSAAYGTNYTGSSTFYINCFPTTFVYQGETIYYCSAHALLDCIKANLDRLYPTLGWQIYIDDSKCITDDYVINPSNWTVAEALSQIHNMFVLKDGSGKHLEYVVRGRNIIIGDVTDLIEDHPELKGLIGYLTDVEDNGQMYYYGYGKGFNDVEDDGHGLFKITRQSNPDQLIVTRLRVSGSEKNLPYRYYNDRYALPQTMFVTKLQLPQTFVPYTGSAQTKPDYEYANKQLANAARDELYDYERDENGNLILDDQGNPILIAPTDDQGNIIHIVRHVKGDSNDAYIDKDDDAEHCKEGVRESSVCFDGNGDLPEIYPTISEAKYSELRANAVPDMDGNTSGSNHFKNYGNNERIDEILAPGDKCNYGSGIMTAKDVNTSTMDSGLAVISEHTIQSLVTSTIQLFATSKSYEGECIMSFTNQHSALHLYMDVGRYVTSMTTEKKYLKLTAKLLVKKAPVSGGSESTIATFTFNPVTLVATAGSGDMRSKELILPDFGEGARDTNNGTWDVNKLAIDTLSIAKCYISITVTQLDQLPSSYGYPSLKWKVDVPTGTETGAQSRYQFANSGADSYVSEPFVLILKDNGITWDNLTLSGSDAVKITMNSGKCSGREFTVDTSLSERYTYTRNGSQVKCWKITCSERATDDSIHTYYPSVMNPIASGDQYVITGIELPDAYVRAAETRLLVAATQFLYDNQETKFTYQPVLDELYLQRDLDKNLNKETPTPEQSIFYRLHAGMIFPFRYNLDDSTDETYSLGTITIENVQIRMGEADVPRVEVKLNDEVTESTQQKLKVTVDRIYGSLFGGAGGGGLNAPALLQYMRTEGTKIFLRKDIDDTAKGNIEFEKSVSVDENLTTLGATNLKGRTTIGTENVTEDYDVLDVYGKSNYQGLSTFNANWNLPFGTTGNVRGSIKFLDYDSADNGNLNNGSINGNGHAVFTNLTVLGRESDATVTDLDGVTEITEIFGEKNTGETERFLDGFDGHGFHIGKDANGLWEVTTDFLTVRQQMKVFELLIQKIRSTGGTIVVSPANGKVKTVTPYQGDYQLTFETDTDFATGDIVRVQTYKGVGTGGGPFVTHGWWGIVKQVSGDVVVIDGSTVTTTPLVGDEAVQWGNTSNTARQNIIYITAAENDYPAVDMLGEIDSINGGNLHVRIGKLDGINTGSQTFIPSGWGLYADNCFLKGKFLLENGDDVYQRFEVADGKMESVITGTKALTSGDSIIANHDFSVKASDRYFPEYWYPFGVDGALLSDGESILSDGENLLGAYGGDNYVAWLSEGVIDFIRIINDSEEEDAGVRQAVSDMTQNLWDGTKENAKMVEMRFSYRIPQDTQERESNILVIFTSTDGTVNGYCSSDTNDDFYGLKTPFVKDGKWHESVYYGTYAGGTGNLFFLARGQVDITNIQCLVTDGVQYLESSVVQTLEQYSNLTTRVTVVEGKTQKLNSSGFFSTADMAAQVSTVVDDPAVATALQVTYPTRADLADYVLQTAYDTAINDIQDELDGKTDESRVNELIATGTAGMVSEGSLNSMFSGYWTFWKATDEGASDFFDWTSASAEYEIDSEGYIVKKNTNPPEKQLKYNVTASISTYNFVEYESAEDKTGHVLGGILLKTDVINQIARDINISAQNINIEGLITANGNFKIDLEGSMSCKDATITGVINNLINVIDVNNGINADKLVSLVIENGVCAGCNNVVSVGATVDCLDVLRLGDVVKLLSTNNRNIFLPFYLCETVWIPSWNENFSCYFRTKTRFGGTEHLISSEDLLQMVGRKINIIVPADNQTNNGILYFPQLTARNESYVPPIFPGSGVNTPIIGLTIANKQAQFIGARLTGACAITLEFKIGELYLENAGAQGTGAYTKCFYWAVTGFDGQLPNWT